MDFLYKLFFEKHDGKATAAVTMFCLFMYALITKSALASVGLQYDPTVKTELNTIFSFLLSTNFLAVLFTYLIVLVLCHYFYLHLFLFFLSYIFQGALKLIKAIAYFVCRIKNDKHFFRDSTIIKLTKEHKVFSEQNGGRYVNDKENYEWFKVIVQDMNDDEDGIENLNLVIASIGSTLLCCYLYDFTHPADYLKNIRPVFFALFILVSIFGMIAIRMIRKKEMLEELLLSIESGPPPATPNLEDAEILTEQDV